jgi:uncharacterized protein
MDQMSGMKRITTTRELTEVVGPVGERARTKERTALTEVDKRWLGASPFCLIATSDAWGNCDVSPKGDPAGFVLVLDDTTIAIPDRPGNRRVDGYHNVVANPHVGLIFLIPGRGDTLRINGSARLVSDAPFFDRMIVRGHRPLLALVVDVEQIFFHCSKAFLRSRLWEAETWNPQSMPSRARLAKQVERTDQTLEELERYYGPSYAQGLYG